MSVLSTETFRVASYNIRKCRGTDRRRDPGRVLSVLADLDADIVALQEADLRLGQRPATLRADAIAARTGLRAVPIGHNAVSLGWHGNAALLSASIALESLFPLDLPGLEPRGALCLDLRRASTQLRFVAVHLGLRRSDRLRQMQAIRAELSRLPHRPTLITGDFNEWSPSRGFEPLASGFSLHAPGRSWHARYPMASLDRFATSPDMALHRSGVHRTALAQRASDHLPIWAEVGLAADRTTGLPTSR